MLGAHGFFHDLADGLVTSESYLLDNLRKSLAHADGELFGGPRSAQAATINAAILQKKTA